MTVAKQDPAALRSLSVMEFVANSERSVSLTEIMQAVKPAEADGIPHPDDAGRGEACCCANRTPNATCRANG